MRSFDPWNLSKCLSRQRINRKTTQIQLHSTQNTCTNDGNEDFGGGFREAIWPIVAIGQAFGVMPVIGISSQSITDLEFKWKSKRTIYGLIALMITSSYALLHIWKTMTQKIVFNSIVDTLFFGRTAFGFISFSVIASKWPEYMKNWEIVELNSTTFHNYKLKKARMLKLRIVAFLFIFLAFVENLLGVISKIQTTNNTSGSLIRILLEITTPFVNDITDYLPSWGAIPFLFIGDSAAFIENYLDIFIMMISIGLSTLFELFNHELEHNKFENPTPEFWCNLRPKYAKLCELVFMVDQQISHIILVSFSIDLLMLCKQLFRLLRHQQLSSLRLAHFMFSLLFCISRTFGMAFLAAQIHDESKKPIRTLLSVPSRAWSTETKRFHDEVHYNTIALSGMQFFFLTRKLILSVVGTICTYEIVLFQLNQD